MVGCSQAGWGGTWKSTLQLMLFDGILGQAEGGELLR